MAKNKGYKPLKGDKNDNNLVGSDKDDVILGGKGDDTIESGYGNDITNGNEGDDTFYILSWGGEPDPAQDDTPIYNDGEPVEDNDEITGGEGADTFIFRWLIDATDEINALHTDANGNIDYSGGGVAGENDNTHDHWVESMGDKTLTDYNPEEGDVLVFEGHTLTLTGYEHVDVDGDEVLDTIFSFESDQGAGGGAHDGDDLGSVTILGHQLTDADITVTANVNYGVQDPYENDAAIA